MTPGIEEIGVEEEVRLEAETEREGPGRDREARTASMSADISEVGHTSNRIEIAEVLDRD